MQVQASPTSSGPRCARSQAGHLQTAHTTRELFLRRPTRRRFTDAALAFGLLLTIILALPDGRIHAASGTSIRGADRLDFQLSTNATSLTTGAWIDYDSLDFVSPVTSGTVGALNGNAAANRTNLSFTINGLNLVNGQTFFIRWLDFNVAN